MKSNALAIETIANVIGLCCKEGINAQKWSLAPKEPTKGDLLCAFF